MTPSPLNPRERARREAFKDAQIRRAMLTFLNSSRGNTHDGYMTAASVLELLQFSTDQSRVPRDHDHAGDLLRDLINAGYAVDRDDRESPADDFRLGTWSLAVTSKGTRLLAHQEAPDLLITDYRHDKPFNQE